MKLIRRYVVPVIVGLGSALGVGAFISAERPTDLPPPSAASDGVLSEKETADAAGLVSSDADGGRLLRQYKGSLSKWSPVELEGASSGAYAEIVFPKAVYLGRPPVIRAANRERSEGTPAKAADGSPLKVKDYALERSELVGAQVERYSVFVDLETMRIVYLAPAAAPPPLAVPPADEYLPDVQPNHAPSANYVGGE
jgi:hypothetical protein